MHAQSRTAFLRFSREDVGGMAGESEFNMCIEREKLFQPLCSLGERRSRVYLEQCLQEQERSCTGGDESSC